MSNQQNKKARGKYCWYCGRPAWNLDHKIPQAIIKQMPMEVRVSLYGNNKVPSCKACNSLKGDKTPQEYRQEIRRWSELPTLREKRRQILEIVSSHGYKFFGEGWHDINNGHSLLTIGSSVGDGSSTGNRGCTQPSGVGRAVVD